MTTDPDANRAKTLHRIGAALAIAEDENAPIGERENAAARAAELMTRHGIDEAQARAARGDAPERLKIYPFAVSGEDGNGRARAQMAGYIVEAMGCRAIHKPAPTPRPYTLIIGGAESDVDALRVLLPLILAQSHYAAAQAPEDQRRARGFLPSFLLGYGHAVAERIETRRRPLIKNAAAAQILADRAERLADLIAERFGELEKAAGVTADTRAAAAGRSAGRTADIGDPRMGATTDRRAIDS